MKASSAHANDMKYTIKETPSVFVFPSKYMLCQFSPKYYFLCPEKNHGVRCPSSLLCSACYHFNIYGCCTFFADVTIPTGKKRGVEKLILSAERGERNLLKVFYSVRAHVKHLTGIFTVTMEIVLTPFS